VDASEKAKHSAKKYGEHCSKAAKGGLEKMKYEIDLNMNPSDVVDALAECEREAGVRRGVYKHWVESGKLAGSVADERQRRMDNAAKILKQCVNTMRMPYQPGLDFSGASVIAGPGEG